MKNIFKNRVVLHRVWKHHLYSKYMLHRPFDAPDVIERYLEPGQASIQDIVLMKHIQYYHDLDVNPLFAHPK